MAQEATLSSRREVLQHARAAGTVGIVGLAGCAGQTGNGGGGGDSTPTEIHQQYLGVGASVTEAL